MNLDKSALSILDPANQKFQPGRPVYVLLHDDHTHFNCLPNGELDWSYNKAEMDLRVMVLKKDFNNHHYHCLKLADAFPIFCNKQAELVKVWTPTINLIRKSKSTEERRTIYERFAARHPAHPLEADAMLKRLLGFS